MEDKEGKKSVKPRLLNYLVPAVTVIVLILSFIFDSKVTFFVSGLRSPVLDFFMLILVVASAYAIVILPTVMLFFSNKKDLLRYWFSFALTLFCIVLLKMIFHRERPFLALDLTIPASLIKASYSAWDFSFPSNHSALSFVAVPFLKGRLFIIWLAISVLIAFSRVYFGLHYLSDALFGILLGYGISFIVTRYILK